MDEILELPDIVSYERILVQLASRAWTLEATHLACQIARMTKAEIVFVKMVSVQHIGWLGTDFGYLDFTEADYNNLQDYAATAEDYGVQYAIQRYQYITFVGGIDSVSTYYGARLIFATPVHAIKIIRTLQYWLLRRTLKRNQRQLADPDVIASILLAGKREIQVDFQDVNMLK